MTTFLVIGGVGIAILLLSLLLGDLFGMEHLNVLDSEFFSTAGIAGFIGAFGFAGAIGLWDSHRLWVGVLAGVVAGLLVGWTAGWLTARLKAGQSGEAPTTDSLVGAEARVIGAIPADGYGRVRLPLGGHLVEFNARADTDLPQGTRTWVSRVLSPTAVHVAAVDTLEPRVGSGLLESHLSSHDDANKE